MPCHSVLISISFHSRLWAVKFHLEILFSGNKTFGYIIIIIIIIISSSSSNTSTCTTSTTTATTITTTIAQLLPPAFSKKSEAS